MLVELQRSSGSRDPLEHLLHALVVRVQQRGVSRRLLGSVAALFRQGSVRRVEMRQEARFTLRDQLLPAEPGTTAGRGRGGGRGRCPVFTPQDDRGFRIAIVLLGAGDGDVEVGDETVQVGVPVAGPFGKGAVDDGEQTGIEAGHQLRQGRRLLVDDPVEHRGRGVAGERPPVGQELIEDQPHGEDVATVVDVPPFDLLRGHVVWRPYGGRAGRGAACCVQPDDPEIDDRQCAGVVADDQVRRLDVAVHDPLSVSVRQTVVFQIRSEVWAMAGLDLVMIARRCNNPRR